MPDTTVIEKVCEIAAAVIPVLWLAVAVDLRASRFVESAPFRSNEAKRDAWLTTIATVMAASAFAEAVTFYGLVVEGRLTAGLFASILLVLYALIGLVLLLVMHAIFPDDWDQYLFEGGRFLLTLLILLGWPVSVPVAIVRGSGHARPAPAAQEEPVVAVERPTG